MEWMFMPLKRYADFSGRSRRMEFWMWQLLQVIVYIIFLMLVMVVGGGAMMAMGDPTAMAAAGGTVMLLFGLYGIYALAIIIPSIAVAVRRLHDTNRSGWWILAPIAPYMITILSGAMLAASPDMVGLFGIIALVSMLAALALALVLLVFYLLEGTKGPNQYGPDPKSPTPAGVFT